MKINIPLTKGQMQDIKSALKDAIEYQEWNIATEKPVCTLDASKTINQCSYKIKNHKAILKYLGE